MQCGDAEVTKLSASVLRPKNNVNLKPKDSVCREDAMRITVAGTRICICFVCSVATNPFANQKCHTVCQQCST